MNRRVVVTGMAGLCPLGNDWETVKAKLLAKQSGIALKPELAEVEGMVTRLAGAVPDIGQPHHDRQNLAGSMGRVSLLACRSAELALEAAGLRDSPLLTSGRLGIAYGSTTGSPPAMENFARKACIDQSLYGLDAAQFVHMLSHTCAVNLAKFLGVRGRLNPTCSACTSGSQGIGYGYETIKWGLQDVMITGGAEELHPICIAVFDILNATSTRHHAPQTTPRPFDKDRDGLVVSEGAATLILESLDHAQGRGAPIFAEIAGFATNSDGRHIVNPYAGAMARVQEEALRDAGLNPGDIDYVNAHGTGTDVGDVAETQATASVFGRKMPISSFKSYMGHTLGACGAIEAWLCIHMMREGWVAPTINLDRVDPQCAPLDYLTEPVEKKLDSVMSNNFAFGGVNTSLVFKRWAP